MSTSPISKITINHDCFLTIFDLVTTRLPRYRYGDPETSHDRPIVVVRTASQVCRQWRELLLDSPWIWGRVIDLDEGFLPSTRKQWMEEIVRRAGSSRLWICGHVSKPELYGLDDVGYFNTEDFFIGLLDRSWGRMERLSVTIHGQDIPEAIQRHFLSRAPALRMFEVSLPHLGNQYLFRDAVEPGRGSGPRGRRPFAGQAQSLHTFNAHQIMPVLSYLGSPWLPHVREMTLPWVNTEDIYTLLRQTPILESLVLQPITFSDTPWVGVIMAPLIPLNGNRAKLPQLSNIRMDADFAGCTRILNYLSTSGKSSGLSVFRLNIYGSRGTKSNPDFPDEIKQFTKDLPLYISNYFQFGASRTSAPGEAFLKLGLGYFEFIDFTGNSDYNPSLVDFSFRTHSNHWEEDEEDSVHNCLLDSIVQAATLEAHPPIFKSMKNLILDFMDIQPTLHRNLYSTLAVFNHVQLLKAGEDCMDTIWELTLQHSAEGNSGLTVSTQAQVLFPVLRVFYLTSITKGQCTGLRRLMTKRKGLGFSLMPRLDLTETHAGGVTSEIVKHDFSIFEEVEGLEVVWKRLKGPESSQEDSKPEYEVCSYLCGSGDPEQLKDLPLHPGLPYWSLTNI